MNFIFVFQFIYFKVILISWPESRINTIHWNNIFLPHFLILISSFNIRFVRHWALWFFFFNLFFMRLSHSHDLDYEFDKLTQLIQAFFFSFSNWPFLFQFYPSTLGWLRIRLHYLFRHVFCKVIRVLWLLVMGSAC
jgi:hypothetical protein